MVHLNGPRAASINFKVIGLTRPGLKNVRSSFKLAIFRFSDLPEREADALLIRPPRLVLNAVCGVWEGQGASRCEERGKARRQEAVT